MVVNQRCLPSAGAPSPPLEPRRLWPVARRGPTEPDGALAPAPKAGHRVLWPAGASSARTPLASQMEGAIAREVLLLCAHQGQSHAQNETIACFVRQDSSGCVPNSINGCGACRHTQTHRQESDSLRKHSPPNGPRPIRRADIRPMKVLASGNVWPCVQWLWTLVCVSGGAAGSRRETSESSAGTIRRISLHKTRSRRLAEGSPSKAEAELGAHLVARPRHGRAPAPPIEWLARK